MCALAGIKGVSTVVRADDDDIDGVSLMSSDSEEERGITLGNAPDAQGAPWLEAAVALTVHFLLSSMLKRFGWGRFNVRSGEMLLL